MVLILTKGNAKITNFTNENYSESENIGQIDFIISISFLGLTDQGFIGAQAWGRVDTIVFKKNPAGLLETESMAVFVH